MKQKILKICSLVLIIVLMPMFFALADPAATSTTVSIDNPLGQKTILDVVNNALSFLLWISIVVGVFVIMWAGFTYITSQGKPDKATAASKMIVNVLIGITVVILAKGIVYLTYEILTGKSPTLEQPAAQNSPEISTSGIIKITPPSPWPTQP